MSSPPDPPASPGRQDPREQTPMPFALPPKKRWMWLWRNQQSEATTDDPVPTTTAPPPSGQQTQIHATPAAAGATATNIPVAPPPAHEADAVLSSPAAAGQKRSSPMPPLARSRDHKPHDAPPPETVDGKPSTPPPCKMERKVVRRVRKVVKKIVPKGTTSSSAASRKETIIAAGTDTSASRSAASQLQTVDEAVAVANEEPEPGEFVPDKKPTADCDNAVAQRLSSLLGAEEEAGEEAAVFAGEPPEVEKKPVSSNQGEEESGVTTGRQNRLREVFVGALHTDAKEEDVRAALAEAGEITEVRMIMDAETTTKNKGYCFVRYREPAQATKAIEELGNVKICGKPCRIKALEIKNGKTKIDQRDYFENYTRNPRARNERNAYAMETSSYGAVPHGIGGYTPIYHHGNIVYLPDSNFYGPAEPWGRIPMRQSGSRGRRPGQPHGSRR